MRFIAWTMYIASIVLANLMTSKFGMVSVAGLLVSAGTFAAGATLVLRDLVQRRSPRWAVPILILIAAVISAATSSPALALASGLAFLVSEVADWGVFSRIQQRNLPLAILVSSAAAAPIDTVLFLHLAGFPLTIEAILGQFIIKTAIAGGVAMFVSTRK